MRMHSEYEDYMPEKIIIILTRIKRKNQGVLLYMLPHASHFNAGMLTSGDNFNGVRWIPTPNLISIRFWDVIIYPFWLIVCLDQKLNSLCQVRQVLFRLQTIEKTPCFGVYFTDVEIHSSSWRCFSCSSLSTHSHIS